MDSLSTVLNPGVLFFLLGVSAALVKSNLSIPEAVVRFLGLYLMMAIGFKGGISLHESSLFGDGIIIIAIILAMSALVPVYSYLLLKRRIGIADAAAIGATYGSNSTLTYITAAGFLTSIGASYEGYMTVALVVMESPAIILSVIMPQMALKSEGLGSAKSTGLVIRESLTDGTLLVLVGSMGIGYLLVILCASSSYIVAPAILKDTLPQANPAKFLTMSMGITFPLNIVFGIPAYWWAVQKFV